MSSLAKAAYIGCICLTVLVVTASLGVYAVYRHLYGNITVVSVRQRRDAWLSTGSTSGQLPAPGLVP
jgi:hypothetical protein